MTVATSRPVQRVAIIGGSLGGLFVAAVLLRRGFDVQVYERNASALAGRGAGIVTHEPLLAALREAGVDAGGDLGIMVPGRRTFARDGSVIGSLAFPQLTTSWDRLLQVLRARVPETRYHPGKALTGVTETGAGVTVQFADGATATADLVVAADGIRSTVRGQLLPEVTPLYAGYVAWRGLIDERALSPAAHAALMHDFTFCLPPGEQVLGYPVAGANNALAVGERRCNIVWYRPADGRNALQRLLTDDAGRLHHGGIPPPLISRRIVDEMRADAERLLAPAFAEAMRLTDMPILQPIFDLTVPRMVIGRVVVIGDAAFVARPHVGAGVTKVAFDAIALADALAGPADLDVALQAFETERMAVGNRIVARARDLGAYMQADIGTTTERRVAALYDTPEAIMRETASLAFMQT